MAAYGFTSEEKWLGGRIEDISIDHLIPSGSSHGSHDCKNMKRNKKGEKILDINQMLVWVKKEAQGRVENQRALQTFACPSHKIGPLVPCVKQSKKQMALNLSRDNFPPFTSFHLLGLLLAVGTAIIEEQSATCFPRGSKMSLLLPSFPEWTWCRERTFHLVQSRNSASVGNSGVWSLIINSEGRPTLLTIQHILLCNSLYRHPVQQSEELHLNAESKSSAPLIRRCLTGVTMSSSMARRWRAKWGWWWTSPMATWALSCSSACGFPGCPSRSRFRTRNWARSKGGGCQQRPQVRGTVELLSGCLAAWSSHQFTGRPD